MVMVAAFVAVSAAACSAAAAAAEEFEGVGVCRKCHLDQAEAWTRTAHAKAYESLRAKAKAAEKVAARLDPDRDYTREAECLECHTTGFGKPGGYRIDMTAGDARQYVGVGCESCHGAGSAFRKEHGSADDVLKSRGETTPRDRLVRAGQNFDYEAACAACHLNFLGSSLLGARAPRPPFTPFTPEIGAKYAFSYRSAVFRSGKGAGVHEHFRLKGVFVGEPVPAIREEIQRNAREPE